MGVAPGELVMESLDAPCFGDLSVDPGEPVTIGRADDCSIRLDDTRVSATHAQVRRIGDAWHVIDLGSHNGTFVNRWKLAPNEPVILQDGDVMAVGPCRFRVTQAGTPVEAAATPAVDPGVTHSGTYATRASLFLRLRDDDAHVQELGWEEFRGRYAPVITGYCRNAGVRAADAEDILQDVLLAMFQRVPEFEYDPQKGRFRGYLKRATLNAIRKRARKGLRVADEQWLDDEAEATQASWQREWERQVLARALDEARRRFDEKTLEAFELYAQRDVPAEEVAKRLGLSVNGVHQAKSRVLNVVRAVVDRIRADEG